MSDIKSFLLYGQMEIAKWKSPNEWLVADLQEERSMLQNILSSRRFFSLREDDVLTWSPHPKGTYTIASGYNKLMSHKMVFPEMQWWKMV